MGDNIGNVGAQPVQPQPGQSANIQDNAQSVNRDGQQFSQVNNDPVSVQQRQDVHDGAKTTLDKIQQFAAKCGSFFSQIGDGFSNSLSGVGNKLSNLISSISDLFKRDNSNNAANNISAPIMPLNAAGGANGNSINAAFEGAPGAADLNQIEQPGTGNHLTDEPGAAFQNLQPMGDNYHEQLTQAKYNEQLSDVMFDQEVVENTHTRQHSDIEGMMADMSDVDTAGVLDDIMNEEDSDDIAMEQTDFAVVDGEDMEVDSFDSEGTDNDKFKNDLEAAQVIEDLVMDDIVADMEASVNPQADTLDNEKIGE